MNIPTDQDEYRRLVDDVTAVVLAALAEAHIETAPDPYRLDDDAGDRLSLDEISELHRVTVGDDETASIEAALAESATYEREGLHRLDPDAE